MGLTDESNTSFSATLINVFVGNSKHTCIFEKHCTFLGQWDFQSSINFKSTENSRVLKVVCSWGTYEAS